MNQPTPLRGIFAPVLTPFRADLSVDVAQWIAFSKQLLADGLHGLCPFGTTSEANSLGVDERSFNDRVREVRKLPRNGRHRLAEDDVAVSNSHQLATFESP